MSVLGDGKLEQKFAKLASVIDENSVRAVQNACKNVIQPHAKMLCPVNYGELRQSISVKVDKDGDGVIGMVYTNKPYAMYVEFGTGPVGKENHNGVCPEVNVSYSQNGWYIPGDKISSADAERYHFPKTEGEEMDFYYTQGQPAQPFMYPALHSNRERVTRNINNYIQRKVRESLK